jgi:diguanylate cyclase (GGDEF)-like protein/PAS domain S-box-containing protein
MGMGWQSLSLRWKLVLGSVLIETVMLTLLVVNSVQLIEDTLHEQVDLRLSELSVLLNASIAPSMAQLDYGPIQGVFAQSRRSEGIVYFALFDRQGKQVAGDGWPVDFPLPKAQMHPDVSGVLTRFDTELPIAIDDQVYGRLQFGMSTEFLVQARSKLLRESLVIALIEITLSIMLLVLLSAWLTRHLAKLEIASREIGRGNFSVSVNIEGSDEIANVGKAFNAMASEMKTKLDALGKSEMRYRTLIERAPDAIVVVDADEQRIIEANPQAERLFEYSREALMQGGLKRLYATDQPTGDSDLTESIREVQRRVFSGESVRIERRMRSSSGRELIAEVRIDDISDGRHRLLRASYTDITERKQAEKALYESELFMRGIFDNAAEGIWVIDRNRCTIRANRALCKILAISEGEMAGTSIYQFVDEENAAILREHSAITQVNGTGTSYEVELTNTLGHKISCLFNSSPLRNAADNILGSFAVVSDITPMKKHQSQLEHIAHYDALTGLPNRVLLADRLHQAIAQAGRRQTLMALVYLDLDGFKPINDNYGHDVGDELLVALSQRLKETLREGDTLARLGGDEFVVVLIDLTDVTECENVLSRMLVAVAEPVQIKDKFLRVSASLGVTLFPRDDGDADTLLRHADQAMYIAKQAGKNRYHLFDVDHDVALKMRHESQELIRRALNQREFVLYFQPKVNMRTGKVIGAEALIRWQHPERGLLPPGEFLPVIEDDPISVELGDWVISAALTQMREWNAAGLNISVSVNVGARQLQQQNFVSRLSALLAAYPEVRAEQLELEILETSVLKDMAQVSELMHACRALGVGFALDDFGTGYSSLTYLKRLSADLLKIDQSFVRDMLDDPDDLAIVQGVVGLANAFHRKVLAEGMETGAHGVVLLRLGCELAQGYGIAKPMPADQFAGWLATWRPDAAWTVGIRG